MVNVPPDATGLSECEGTDLGLRSLQDSLLDLLLDGSVLGNIVLAGSDDFHNRVLVQPSSRPQRRLQLPRLSHQLMR